MTKYYLTLRDEWYNSNPNPYRFYRQGFDNMLAIHKMLVSPMIEILDELSEAVPSDVGELSIKAQNVLAAYKKATEGE